MAEGADFVKIFASGAVSAGIDLFTVTVHGKGGHASAPYTTIDPINIASHIVINLQTINSREVDAQEAVVLDFGAINSGVAGNIIPETAVLKGNIRTFNNDVRKQVKKRITEIVEQTAAMFGGSDEKQVREILTPEKCIESMRQIFMDLESGRCDGLACKQKCS